MTHQKKVKVSEEVLVVLKAMVWSEDGLTAKIVEQVDQKLYVQVDKVLFGLGGVWKSGKIKGHVFQEDPRPMIEGLLETGEIVVVKDDFFETPALVVKAMIDRVGISNMMDVLEPSAGAGAIVRLLRPLCASIFAIELDPHRSEKLRLDGFNCKTADFLEYKFDIPYARVFMNPPFSKGQDVDHVLHAWEFVSPKNGKLVAVMGEHAFFATDQKSQDFRDWLKKVKGESLPLPAGSFKDSGTGVNARIVWIEKKGRK